MKNTILAFAVLTITLAGNLHAEAQAPSAGSGPQYEDETSPEAAGASEAKREEVRKKIEAIRIWRMTEALKLDEKTSAQFTSFLSSIDGKRRTFIKSNRDSIKELRNMLNTEKAEEAKLKATLEKIERNQHALQDLQQKEREGVKNMLTTEQQARYAVFQQDFRREVRGMIAEARGSGSGRGGQMRRPGRQ